MKKIWSEYRDFINQGDVVTIAVGLVMALFFKDVIDRLVANIIMPIISAIVGQPNFASIGFFIRGDGEVVGTNDDGSVIVDGGGTFLSIGQVLSAVLIFLIVAFVLYLIVKAYNSYIAKPHQEIEASDTELSLLKEIRDELRAGSRASGFGGTPPPPPTV